MNETSFFRKVISYLAELNKGTENKLLESGWLNEEEEKRIKVILAELCLIDNMDGKYYVSPRGLNVLLYYKMGKIQDSYNSEILDILLNG